MTAADIEKSQQDAGKHHKTASGDFDPDDKGDYLDEIYDIVDAVVPRPTMPVLTFRVWVLGGFFCVALCVANTLFTFRTNQFATNPVIGVVHNLCAVQHHRAKYQLYQESLTDVAAVFFAINTQIMGYGLAGICRRHLVRPAAMLWPSNLSVVAMLQTLHEKQGPDEQYKTSRYKFFWLVTLASCIWAFFPGYIAPIFTAVSILCYVAPSTSNPQLTGMLGSANQVWIMVWTLTPIFWSKNAFGIDQQLGANPIDGPNGSGRFYLGQAVNTPSLFNKHGVSVPARKFVIRPSLVLNETFYD
ncbi:hypothetical protein HDU96_000409 [Phlyctochytrium bullatum]|nr:hypothetical protein HDU96_000409 [Phlyctochytrium bullatum]